MNNRVHKKDKLTYIEIDEASNDVFVFTYDMKLKTQMTELAEQYPQCCQITYSNPDTGCMEFSVERERFSFRVTAPYLEERTQKHSRCRKTWTT